MSTATAVHTYTLTTEEAGAYNRILADIGAAADAYAQNMSEATIRRCWELSDELLAFEGALRDRFNADPLRSYIDRDGDSLRLVYRETP